MIVWICIIIDYRNYQWLLCKQITYLHVQTERSLIRIEFNAVVIYIYVCILQSLNIIVITSIIAKREWALTRDCWNVLLLKRRRYNLLIEMRRKHFVYWFPFHSSSSSCRQFQSTWNHQVQLCNNIARTLKLFWNFQLCMYSILF